MPEILTFKIEDFEGPLDLLLYLVGKNKMNLYDINIMALIEQYTAAIREMQQDRMEVSSEFIDMAAHLVQMKSALLLPRSPEAERMKAELTGRLIEYSACKEVAAQLGSRARDLYTAALEVLAVIAYNQPVSRSFIEQVRGVDSSSTVTKLLDKGLIEEAGRLDLPGKPVAFQVTDTFLRVFGLGSLNDLPPLHGEVQEESAPEADDDAEQLEWK